MNEFTKDELQIILDWSEELSIEYGTQGTDDEINVTRKIQSLIDNYCEHEFSKRTHIMSGHKVMMCDKCEQIKE